MSEGEVEALKARLSKLGVQLGGTVVPTSPLEAADLAAAEELLRATKSSRRVPRVNRWKETSLDLASPISSPTKPKKDATARSPALADYYDSDASVDVTELLERCSRVERILGGAEAATRKGPGAAPNLGFLAEALKQAGGKPRSPRRQQQRSGKKQQPEAPRASSAPRNLSARRAAQAQAAAMHLNAPAAALASLKTSPLGSVLEQYREAEAMWMQEKAKLRRELVTQRKRANKFESDYKKLQDAHNGRSVDLKSLRAALKDRDASLKQATLKLSETEEALRRSNETAALELACLSEERDDLKALLQATLQRLEAVDEVLHRADVSTAMMEQKVKALDLERLKALNEAAVARAEANTLAKSKSKLDWQSKLLERMSEMQKAGRARAARDLGSGGDDSDDSDDE